MALIFPESFLQEVMDRNDIVDIASRFVSLKRSGGTLKGLCPFHKERPHLYCFAGQAAILLLWLRQGRKHHRLCKGYKNPDFVEAVKTLRSSRNGHSDTNEGGAANNAKLRRTIYKINSCRTVFTSACTPKEKKHLNISCGGA